MSRPARHAVHAVTVLATGGLFIGAAFAWSCYTIGEQLVDVEAKYTERGIEVNDD